MQWKSTKPRPLLHLTPSLLAPLLPPRPRKHSCSVLCCYAVEGDVDSPEESGNITDAYKQLWQVVKLPAVKRFALVLVTFR